VPTTAEPAKEVRLIQGTYFTQPRREVNQHNLYVNRFYKNVQRNRMDKSLIFKEQNILFPVFEHGHVTCMKRSHFRNLLYAGHIITLVDLP
jgi:hypothetical protein